MVFERFSQINNNYRYGIYYRTTFVQLCCHNAIDEWNRLLIKFVMFRKFYDIRNNENLIILDNSGRLCTNVIIDTVSIKSITARYG